MSVDKWDQRMLCPDGGCVGVIGMDGKCKVCGRPAPDWGDPRKPGRVSSKAEDGELDDSAEPVTAEPASDDRAKDDRAKKTWTSRQLCSDGSCIGVIGSDGTCKVCGKPAEAKSYEDVEEEYENEDDDVEDEDAEASDDEDDRDEVDDGGEEEDEDAEDENEGVDDDDGDDDEDEIEDSDGESDEEDEGEEDEEDEEDEDADEEEGEARKLCIDGACVGVIGNDGKCKVCGKAAA